MTMICSICNHPKRLEIDRDIVQGRALATIVRKFNTPYSALYRHKQNCIHRQLATAWEKKELQENFDLLSRIDKIIQRADDIFKRNYDAKHDVTALKALDTSRNTIELLAKISYSYHQAKIAEVELLRMQSNEPDQQAAQEFQESLKILSDTELHLLERLSVKLKTQDKSIKIEYETKPSVLPHDPSMGMDKSIPHREIKVQRTKMSVKQESRPAPEIAIENTEQEWEPPSGQKVLWVNGNPIR